MYRYDEFDQEFVTERVAQLGDRNAVLRIVGEFAQHLRQAARRGHRWMEDARNGLRMLRFLFHSFRPRTAPHFPCGNCAGMVLTPGERCGPASDCRFTNGAIREYPASIHK